MKYPKRLPLCALHDAQPAHHALIINGAGAGEALVAAACLWNETWCEESATDWGELQQSLFIIGSTGKLNKHLFRAQPAQKYDTIFGERRKCNMGLNETYKQRQMLKILEAHMV